MTPPQPDTDLEVPFIGHERAERFGRIAALGCRLMVTATGEAVPGDPQHSYRNILRAGFRPSDSRANWTPARTYP